MSTELLPAVVEAKLPAIREKPHQLVAAAGPPASRVWRDFFKSVKLKSPHTHRAYNHAVARFLDWCEEKGLELPRIMPGDVAEYLGDHLGGSPSTQKVHRSAIKKFFDPLVIAHVCVVNPAVSVSTPTLKRLHGTTPMIDPDEIKTLMASIDTTSLAGLRDRAAIAILGYTGCRAAGVAKLRRGHYRGRPGRMQLYFQEKGGNHNEIEVRSDLEQCLDEYLAAAKMKTADKDCPLFRPLVRKQQQFRPWVQADKTKRVAEHGTMSPNDVCRMVKRRMRAAHLREELSAHSFRTAVATDLIDQGVPIEDVQELLGHADARTTKLYDRTQRRATRNLVERIRLKMTPGQDDTSKQTEDEEARKIMKAELSLRIERNNKFVRGMKPSRESIETFVLPRYGMEPQKDGDYIIYIPYDTEDDLEQTCYDILNDCENSANTYNCWTEGTIFALDGSERHWG